ncbi:MAG: tripartite tricarboxylate transporter TctB family protein [Negativicutes bacterium]
MYTEKRFSMGALLVCLIYLSMAFQHPFGNLSEPGPGFVPILLSCVGILTALIILMQRKAANNSAPLNEEANAEDATHPQNVLLYILTVCISTLVFTYLGAIVAVTLLTIVLLKISGVDGRLLPLLIGISTAASLHIVFGYWLKINLPHGLL